MANHLLVSCMAKLKQLKKGISQDILADRQIFFSESPSHFRFPNMNIYKIFEKQLIFFVSIPF